MRQMRTIGIWGFLLFMLGGIFAPARAAHTFHTLQKIVSYKKTPQGIDLVCLSDEHQKVLVRMDVCAPDLIRIRMSVAKKLGQNDALIVKKTWKAVPFVFREQPQCIVLKTSKLQVKIRRKPFGFDITESGKSLLKTEIPDGMRYTNKFAFTFLKLASDEHFFGFGAAKGVGMTSWSGPEHFNLLDKRGQEINILGRRIPFFMSTKGYGIFVNSPNLTTFEMGSKMPGRYSLKTAGKLLDFYFLFGPDFKHILSRYTELVGRAPLIPRWAFGLRQAGYWDQNQVETFAKKYRTEQLPCDLIHIDSGWLDKGSPYSGQGIHFGNHPIGYVDFKWDRRQFPSPKSMISKLKKQGYKISLWETSLVNPNVGEFYEKAASQGYFMKQPDGSVALIHYSSRGPSAVVDFSNPKAAEWWKEQHQYLINMGIDAFKLDISSDLSNAKQATFYNGRNVKQMRILHKLWNVETVFDAVKEYTHRRGYVISSIATVGTQRFPVHWSGDYSNDFEGIQGKIRSSQNMGLSGFAYYSPDFPSRRNLVDSVLFIRWSEYGLMNPVCQDWCNLPWNFGKQAEDIFRFYDRLHYRLIPYFYSYAWEAHQTGVPIVRALVLEYQNDPHVYDKGLQYLLGKELLVAPICANSNPGNAFSSREVYLPAGKWIDYWTGRIYSGHRNIVVKAALDKIPLFVKAGAIIPMGPVMDFVGQKSLNPLTLDIYPSGVSSFTLYEDDGETYQYEKGAFALTTFICSEQPDQITVEIGASRGAYANQLHKRDYILKINQVHRPVMVKLASKKIPSFASRQQFGAHKRGWWYEAKRHCLWVKTGTLKTKMARRVIIQRNRAQGSL